jgi:hypothetical protein
MATKGVVTFKTLQRTNVVMLKNPSKRKILTPTGINAGKVKKIEPIMYCRDHDTIIQSELTKLDPDVKATSISTRKGVFRVQEEDIYLLEYLRDTEQNEANGGKLFREVNVAKEEAFEIEAFEAFDKARNAVMAANDSELRSLAMTFISPSAVHYTAAKIKITLRTMLSNSDGLVDKVNTFLSEKIAQERLLIATAITENLIAIHEGRKFVWSDSKEVFFTASQTSNAVDEMALWLKNDEEGRSYLKALAKKIKDLPKKD